MPCAGVPARVSGQGDPPPNPGVTVPWFPRTSPVRHALLGSRSLLYLFIYFYGPKELLSTASRGLIRAFPAAISHGVGTAAHEGGTLTVTTSRTRSAHRRSSLPRIRPPARMCAVMGDLCTAHSRTGIYEDQLMNPSPPWCSAPSGARR